MDIWVAAEHGASLSFFHLEEKPVVQLQLSLCSLYVYKT